MKERRREPRQRCCGLRSEIGFNHIIQTSTPHSDASKTENNSCKRVRKRCRCRLVRRGQKELSPKYFYDDLGSALFEAITLLPEYGLTRADLRLLDAHAADLAALLGNASIVAGTGKRLG